MFWLINARHVCCFKRTYGLSAWVCVCVSGVADSKSLSLGSHGGSSCGPFNEATSCGNPCTSRLWLRIPLLTSAVHLTLCVAFVQFGGLLTFGLLAFSGS
jgi:hypothetical protein